MRACVDCREEWEGRICQVVDSQTTKKKNCVFLSVFDQRFQEVLMMCVCAMAMTFTSRADSPGNDDSMWLPDGDHPPILVVARRAAFISKELKQFMQQ